MSGSACFRCGDAIADAAESQQQCRACRMAPPAFIRAVSFGLYEGRMKAAIHALKYDGLRPAALELGQRLAAAIALLASDAPAEMLVIPVPLHRSRLAQRGFNQSRALAHQALGVLAKSHPQWRLTLASSSLLRQRPTAAQAGLTPRQRRQNVRGAFAVADPAAIAKKDILLIDDILTTGATARAAAQTLSDAGAASVRVATLARARLRFTPGSAIELERLDADPDQLATHAAASMVSSVNQPSFL